MEELQKKLIFGKDNISTGAGGGSGSDINQATQLARAMVTKYGMSEEMGPIEYGENQEEVFLGRSVTQTTISFRRNWLKK